MSETPIIYMNVAEIVVAEEPHIVSTILGSCVSVALFSAKTKMGGINHFALPSEQYASLARSAWGPDSLDAMTFGSLSIPMLIEELCRRTGTSSPALQAKIVGGASVVKDLKQMSKIGSLNVTIAREILKKHGIPIVGMEIGGTCGRKLRFHTGTGRLLVAPMDDRAAADNRAAACELSTRFPDQRHYQVNSSGLVQIAADEKRVKSEARKKVLIVDDSKTIRRLLTKLFQQDAALDVVGAAGDPAEAEVMLSKLKPDVMTLDVHMPGMDGVTFLEKILPKKAIPVVMITSLNIEESALVLRALEIGAVDYIQKPEIAELASLGPIICERVRIAASARVKRKKTVFSKAVSFVSTHIDRTMVIAIGASTGGTEAIKDVLVRLPKEIPPILIVQHIPATFSRTFANRLNELCPFEVKEAEDGDAITPGKVLVAPGGWQMAVVSGPKGYQVRVKDDLPVNRHKPSVDYLFNSVADQIGKKAVGILLTGMGNDGAAGLLGMKQSGAYTIAQDEVSCVVYGMPKAAVVMGAVQQIASLDAIPDVLMSQLNLARKAS